MYPHMEMQDWYKLLHQGAMGNRHLGVEDSLVLNFLLAEWQAIEASDTEPLLEYITPDSTMLRLNLRPYKGAGGNPERLFDAMKRTWNILEPDPQKLQQHIEQLHELAQQEKLSIPPAAIDSFLQQMQQAGYPAIHHSERYMNAYNPAYRVLHQDVIGLVLH